MLGSLQFLKEGERKEKKREIKKRERYFFFESDFLEILIVLYILLND